MKKPLRVCFAIALALCGQVVSASPYMLGFQAATWSIFQYGDTDILPYNLLVSGSFTYDFANADVINDITGIPGIRSAESSGGCGSYVAGVCVAFVPGVDTKLITSWIVDFGSLGTFGSSTEPTDFNSGSISRQKFSNTQEFAIATGGSSSHAFADGSSISRATGIAFNVSSEDGNMFADLSEGASLYITGSEVPTAGYFQNITTECSSQGVCVKTGFEAQLRLYTATVTAIPVADIPEPGSLALVGLGLSGLFLRRKAQARL